MSKSGGTPRIGTGSTGNKRRVRSRRPRSESTDGASQNSTNPSGNKLQDPSVNYHPSGSSRSSSVSSAFRNEAGTNDILGKSQSTRTPDAQRDRALLDQPLKASLSRPIQEFLNSPKTGIDFASNLDATGEYQVKETIDFIRTFKDYLQAFRTMGDYSNRLGDSFCDYMSATSKQLDQLVQEKQDISDRFVAQTKNDSDLLNKINAQLSQVLDENSTLKIVNKELREVHNTLDHHNYELQTKLDELKESMRQQSEPAAVTGSNTFSVLENTQEDEDTQENSELREKIEDLEETIRESKSTISNLEKQLQSKTDSALTFKTQVSESQVAFKKVVDAQSTLQEELDSLRERLAKAISTEAHTLRYSRLFLESGDKLNGILERVTGKPSQYINRVARDSENKDAESVQNELSVTELYVRDLAERLETAEDKLGKQSDENRNDEVLELTNKLAAKEEAVAYLKDRERELQDSLTSLSTTFYATQEELSANQAELGKVKGSFLLFMKKSMDKKDTVTNFSIDPDFEGGLDILHFQRDLVKKEQEYDEMERQLKYEIGVLKRDRSKALKAVDKMIHRNPVENSKHKRSKEREDNMAILQANSGNFDISSDGKLDPRKIKKLLQDKGLIATTSVKVISSDAVIIRTPEPLYKTRDHTYLPIWQSSQVQIMHISSWHQLIVHDVPFLPGLKTIGEVTAWLHHMLPYKSLTGMFANTIACKPRILNPLEFFSGKSTASFILCYSSDDLFEAALKSGIALIGEARTLRTEPVLGYMKNPFNQIGFMMQFEPFSQFYKEQVRTMQDDPRQAILDQKFKVWLG